MSLDDGSDKSSFLCLRKKILLLRFFFFGDESKNDGSGFGSSGTCDFSFYSENSVGSVSGIGSDVFVPTGIESMGDFVPLVLFVPIEVESKVGQLIEKISCSKY